MRMDHRTVAFALLLSLAGIGYAAFALTVGREPAASVRRFGATAAADVAVPRLQAYAEVLAVDPVNDSVRLRISLTPNRALQGKRLGTLGRPVLLQISDGTTDREIDLPVDQPVPTQTIEADLNEGAIGDYPFDRFTAKMQIDAIEDPPAQPPRHVPIDLVVWDGIAGWTVQAEPGPGTAPGMSLAFALQRPLTLRFMVTALYGVMGLIALAALTIAGSVFTRMRKLEATLGGILATMMFSLPVMRYGLPGAPPIGVRADVLVYLWAQIGTALSLFLFVATWARGEPRQG